MVPGIGVECVCLSDTMLAKAGTVLDVCLVAGHGSWICSGCSLYFFSFFFSFPLPPCPSPGLPHRYNQSRQAPPLPHRSRFQPKTPQDLDAQEEKKTKKHLPSPHPSSYPRSGTSHMTHSYLGYPGPNPGKLYPSFCACSIPTHISPLNTGYGGTAALNYRT